MTISSVQLMISKNKKSTLVLVPQPPTPKNHIL
jgi:hypothetical protein